MIDILYSTKGGYPSGRKNVQEKLPEQNGGDSTVDINPLEHRLLRRAKTFDFDRQILLGGSVDVGTNVITPTKLLEKIISQTIERTMEKVQGEFLRKPNAKVEDFFSLGPIEAKQLWETDLQSVREFRGKILPGGSAFAREDITDTNLEYIAAELERRSEGKTHCTLRDMGTLPSYEANDKSRL